MPGTLHTAMIALVGLAIAGLHTPLAASAADDPTAAAVANISQMKVGPGDWPQWGGWQGRNNTPPGENIPVEWDIEANENIVWSARLGSQSYGNPVVANGRVLVGTNNGAGYISRYPGETVDLGCLLCFDEKTGDFLWQDSKPKLPTGRVHDWPLQGICCSPYVEGDRVWYVTSRGEVSCLDLEGFRDNENDGPFVSEPQQNPYEADVVWLYDMMAELGTSQHNMCSCSVTCAGNLLFVITANGVDESHINIPSPDAASFMVMEKDSGKVLWTDNSPRVNILHGQWSSPTYGVLGGRPQVLFAGGDGWLRSFAPEGDGNGKSKLLWKCDCNPKDSKWELGGRGTRNNIIATPIIYDGKVYVAVGQDPEHGEGIGHLWCVDPTKSGDVSATMVVDGSGQEVLPLVLDAAGTVVSNRRLQALDVANPDEKIVPNPNSAIIWHYSEYDVNGDGKIKFEETMHRSIGTATIKDDILYIADFSGLVHCLDAQTGKPYWTHDMFAASWGSALIVDGKVYIGDEDGEVTVFKHGRELEILAENDMQNAVYTSPIVANNTLFICNKSQIFAIRQKAE